MDLRAEAHTLFRENRRVHGEFEYTVPSPSTYPYQWLWDSCFHAIILSMLEPEAAKKELRALVSKQFPDGLIPHIIFWDLKITRPYNWDWIAGTVTSITQPPMLAYAAWEIFRRTGDRTFLEELYPKILLFYQYLIQNRDPQDHHIIGIINPDESGEDNSPRFDIPLHVSTDISFLGHMQKRRKLIHENRVCNFDAEICMSKNFWVKDVPFNAILVKNLETLSHIASLLGHEQGEQFGQLHSGLVKEAMRERLMADGIFWSAMDHDYKPLRVATWAHFAPLFAGLYTKPEADALMEEHFGNHETFRSRFGIRSVSKQEAAYRPDGFWRGPIWFAPHWFIYQGLMTYGYKTEAKFISDATMGLVERNGFREYFNPETGEAYGAKRFTWGALALDMVEEKPATSLSQPA
jgi:glycogen debranching enzyme